MAKSKKIVQWRLFYQTGKLHRRHRSPDEAALARVVGLANRVQMVRFQVVGVLASFLKLRANDFARIVQRSHAAGRDEAPTPNCEPPRRLVLSEVDRARR